MTSAIRSKRGFVQCGKEGYSDADVRTFWCKNFGFFRFTVYPHGQYGKKGGESFFAMLCGRLLWSAPKAVLFYMFF